MHKDGIDLDPELCFINGFKKYMTMPPSMTEIECCVSGDGCPVRKRGKWEGQTVVGFKFGDSQSLVLVIGTSCKQFLVLVNAFIVTSITYITVWIHLKGLSFIFCEKTSEFVDFIPIRECSLR